jgi:hypothetical protein
MTIQDDPIRLFTKNEVLFKQIWILGKLLDINNQRFLSIAMTIGRAASEPVKLGVETQVIAAKAVAIAENT